MTITVVIALVLFAALGAIIGFAVRSYMLKVELTAKQGRAEDIISSAKTEANDIKFRARKEAKEIVKEEREEFEKEMRNKQNEIRNIEKDLTKKDTILEEKLSNNEKEAQRLKSKETELTQEKEKIAVEVDNLKNAQTQYINKISEVAQMTPEAARDELSKMMENDARTSFAKSLKRLEEEHKEDSEKMAKNIISTAIHRFAGEYVGEKTIGSVELPSDDIKGRLIGREGRNIRAFEQICGVDLIIDDTPGVVVISSFNVVRKEIARQTIMKLIADGRIHPAKIEEFYEKAKVEMDKQLRELGEKAQMELGLHGIHPEILKLVGALNWRTSYTQNQYQHALETAFIAGSIAAEMGLNVKQARRAGLLHDIGKVIDASAEGSHAVVGASFLKKYGESHDIIHAVRAHHDDEKPESVLAHIIVSADALSGARPGARKAMMESYITRLSDIEAIVNSFEGVSNSYAISGGREVRVFVENSTVSDEKTVLLSHDIAKKIESEMTYPGTIKVTVVRETKSVGIAR